MSGYDALFVDGPPADQRFDKVWALVARHPDGGEAIFGMTLPGLGLTNFVTGKPSARDAMEGAIDREGIRDIAAKFGVELVWREYSGWARWTPAGQNRAARRARRS